jgi:bile acid:Na+ symporter, BASS family
MKKNNLFKALLFLSIAFFTAALVLGFTDIQNVAGRLLLAGFITLALAIRGFPRLKGFSYTVWIFAAVTLSMMFPGYFIKVGDFEMKLLIVPLLQVIMFGMGSQMSLQDFSGVIKMPKGVIIGVVLQFTIMPLVGFSIAHLFKFPAEIAAGILLIGCAPSGLASGLALQMGKLATVGLAPAVFGPLMNITGSSLAMWWKGKSVKGEEL